MVEDTKQKVPQIRFKEFSKEWNERGFLSNILKVIDFRGRTPKKLGLDWSEAGYLALSALNVKNGYIDFAVEAHYGNQELYDLWMKGNDLHKNQVLFTTEAPMGNVAQIPDGKKYILSQRTIAFDVISKKIHEDFLATLLGSPRVLKKLSSMSSGGTAKGVSQKSLASLDVSVPADVPEQIKIGAYLKSLDCLIGQHKRKHVKLLTLKKAMLKKMFPAPGAAIPEVRFKGFSDPWKEKSLEDLTERVQGNDGRMDLPTLTISAASGWLDQRDRFYSNIAGNEQKNYTLLKKGQLSYNHGNSKLAKYGVVFELANFAEALVPRVYHSFKANENADPAFIEYLFATKIPDTELGKLISSGARMDGLLNISFAAFMGILVSTPTQDEQQKIGAYFRQLDRLLAKHTGQIEKLRQLKDACLEKMFV